MDRKYGFDYTRRADENFVFSRVQNGVWHPSYSVIYGSLVLNSAEHKVLASGLYHFSPLASGIQCTSNGPPFSTFLIYV